MGFWSWFKNRFSKKPENLPASIPRGKGKTPLKLGLALSGGGTRGVAYIGVFKALQEANIEFDYVAGTSVGSIMGAVYCTDMTIEQMIKIAKSLRAKDIKSSKIPYVPSKTDKLRSVIREILSGKGFEDLNKPFTAVAVDIISGEEKRLTSGPLDAAIAGSCAVPTIFNPVDFGPYRLFDGGLQNNIPANVAREMGADIVIAFDLNPTRGYGTTSTKYLDLMKAVLRILMKSNSVNGYVHSDYIVKLDLSQYNQTKLDNIDEMIRVGYETTKAEMHNILKAIGRETPNEDIKKTAKKLRAIEREARRAAAKAARSGSATSAVKEEISNSDEKDFEKFLSEQATDGKSNE